jgi:alkanesulfonate monooxygenase SsuD/methylene tetrahydromethanopterin reductase-like flavin-dependent oxidoreductase (luciferase family)
VFVLGANPQVVGQYIRDTREKARQQGRNPDDLLFLAYVKVITGDTEAAARRKYEEFFEQISYDGGLALLSGWTGIDFGQFAPEQPLEYIETNAIRTIVHGFTEADPSRKWTMRDLAKYVGIGGAGPVLVGTPEQLAETFQEWVQAGVDGFNLAYAITPATFVDFIEGVVPVLQRRGLMQTEYQEGTLREKLFGSGQARLRAPHPAAQYRRAGANAADGTVQGLQRSGGSAGVSTAK